MLKHILLFVIKLYQYFISPFLGKNCKFHPTCSAYAIEAITHYGALKGSFLTTKRLLNCQPFSKKYGYDPLIHHKN
jgi:putative membrane protein insertion efficiency factor